MKVLITVYSPNEFRVYRALIETRDYRQVLNEVRKGRRIIGPGNNISTIHLEGDKRPFRVGLEKDIAEWLQGRFK